MMKASYKVPYKPLAASDIHSDDSDGRPSFNQYKSANNGGEDPANVVAEAVELRSRGSRGRTKWESDHERSDSNGSTNGNNQTVDVELDKDDTLQKIALKYSVQVSELKRLNNLISDQDFFGLQRIRIPARKFAQQRNKEEDEENQPCTSSSFKPLSRNFVLTDKLISLSDDDGDSGKDMHDRALMVPYDMMPLREGSNNEEDCPNAHFNQMINKVDQSLKQVKQNADRLERQSQLTDDSGFHFYDATEPTTTSHWYTSYWVIVVILLIMFVVIPIFVTIFELGGGNEQHANT